MPILRQMSKQAAATAGIVIVATALASCAQHTEAGSAALTAKVTALEEKNTKLEAALAALSDRQQIHDVYIHYMRGFDRNDVELMRTAFWPDVQINYGKQSNTFEEFVTRHLNQHVSTLAHWGHLITNESVEIAGDVAHAEAYVTRFSDDKKDGKSMIINGRYIDRLDRRNGEWRIAVREFVPHFVTKTATTVGTYMPKDGWSRTDCGWGTWDKRDPSYLRPLTARTDKAIGPACAGDSASNSGARQ